MAATNALLVAILMMLGAIAGMLIAPGDRRSAGAAFGFFLGPLGMAIAAGLTPQAVIDEERRQRSLRRAAARTAAQYEKQRLTDEP